MKNNHTFRRYVMLVIGLCIMAFGVAFSIKGGLGTSPISSVPYVLSLILPLTVGQTTILLHCMLILLQILLLRRNFELVQLMQLPVALAFGYLTDFAVWVTGGLPAAGYLGSWGYCLIGILLVGIAVSCEVTAGVVTLAGEGMVLAVCKAFHTPFPKTKISFDCTLVLIAVILSLVFLHQLEGVREGTVAAAIFVGMVSKRASRLFMDRLAAKIFAQPAA